VACTSAANSNRLRRGATLGAQPRSRTSGRSTNALADWAARLLPPYRSDRQPSSTRSEGAATGSWTRVHADFRTFVRYATARQVRRLRRAD
jgi:hypothetical protein